MKPRAASHWFSAAAAVLALSAFGVGQANEAQPAPTKHAASTADHPGKPLVETSCAKCHDLVMVTSQRKSREDWSMTVDKMMTHGAPITDQQAEQIIDYLAQAYAPGK